VASYWQNSNYRNTKARNKDDIHETSDCFVPANYRDLSSPQERFVLLNYFVRS
jgi:hypothetical protein